MQGPFYVGAENITNADLKNSHNTIDAGIQSAQALLILAQNLIGIIETNRTKYIPAATKKQVKDHLLTLINKI